MWCQAERRPRAFMPLHSFRIRRTNSRPVGRSGLAPMPASTMARAAWRESRVADVPAPRPPDRDGEGRRCDVTLGLLFRCFFAVMARLSYLRRLFVRRRDRLASARADRLHVGTVIAKRFFQVIAAELLEQ